MWIPLRNGRYHGTGRGPPTLAGAFGEAGRLGQGYLHARTGRTGSIPGRRAGSQFDARPMAGQVRHRSADHGTRSVERTKRCADFFAVALQETGSGRSGDHRDADQWWQEEQSSPFVSAVPREAPSDGHRGAGPMIFRDGDGIYGRRAQLRIPVATGGCDRSVRTDSSCRFNVNGEMQTFGGIPAAGFADSPLPFRLGFGRQKARAERSQPAAMTSSPRTAPHSSKPLFEVSTVEARSRRALTSWKNSMAPSRLRAKAVAMSGLSSKEIGSSGGHALATAACGSGHGVLGLGFSTGVVFRE